jgi:hypothetical protein
MTAFAYEIGTDVKFKSVLVDPVPDGAEPVAGFTAAIREGVVNGESFTWGEGEGDPVTFVPVYVPKDDDQVYVDSRNFVKDEA